MTCNYTRPPENGHAAPPVAASPGANPVAGGGSGSSPATARMGSRILRIRLRPCPTLDAGGRRGKPRFFLHYEEEDSSAKVIAHD